MSTKETSTLSIEKLLDEYTKERKRKEKNTKFQPHR